MAFLKIGEEAALAAVSVAVFTTVADVVAVSSEASDWSGWKSSGQMMVVVAAARNVFSVSIGVVVFELTCCASSEEAVVVMTGGFQLEVLPVSTRSPS